MNYTQPEVYEYISKQTNDAIVERKTCSISGTTFAIFQSDLEFYEKISPTFNGKKYLIPTPTLCPEERQRRRYAWRNERSLYKRKSDATDRSIVSNYKPGTPYHVFEIDQWFSDQRDQYEYGLENDITLTFNEQFNKLLKSVPHISLMVKMNENCDYVNGCGNSKNCYLVFDTDYGENCYYSGIVKHSKEVVDSNHIYFSEVCFNCINCTESFHLMNCYECDKSSYLYNCSRCSGCTNCYGCTNLVNKSYHIYNKPVSEDEWKRFIETVEYTDQYPDGLTRSVYKVSDEYGIGNNLYSTKNCVLSHNIGYSQDSKYCDLVTDVHDCYDVSSFGGTTQWCLECSGIGMDCSNIYFSNVITAGSKHVFYSFALFNCQHMFGCSFMKNASYCIFNKQYTKQDYEVKVAELIESMIEEGTRGEFLDPAMSPFGYNETIAMDYFTLEKKEALKLGFTRSEYEYQIHIPEGASKIEGRDLPEQVSEVDDSICNKIIICEESGTPFRIIKQELEFYRKHTLPLPRKHPEVRHRKRLGKRPGRTLFLRSCDCCDKEMLSVYDESGGKEVYCEVCYQKEIFS